MARQPEQRFSGWRVGIAANACLIFIVFIVNLAAYIWTFTNFDVESGTSTLTTGHCASTEKANTWIHVVINVLSTAMLSGSNYCVYPRFPSSVWPSAFD